MLESGHTQSSFLLSCTIYTGLATRRVSSKRGLDGGEMYGGSFLLSDSGETPAFVTQENSGGWASLRA